MIECRVVGGLKKKRRKEEEEREWLVNLLGNKYFEACVDHRELRKNEKNVFCIDCNLSLCKHCIISSSNHCQLQFHRRLQICRYVYHDVVRLLDIQKYIDCSKIQTYKINGEKAVHLNPRPPQTQSQGLRDAKTTKGGTGTGTCCLACGRHIQDLPNRFCSIACKVSVVAEIRKDDDYMSYPFAGLSSKDNSQTESTLTSSTDISLEEIQATARASWLLLSPNKKKKKLLHKRKGVPHRAPLC